MQVERHGALVDPAASAEAELDPDARLLLRSVRRFVTRRGDPGLGELAAHATAVFADQAVENKLAVLALQGLSAEAARLPPPVRERLEAERARTIQLNTASLLAIRRIVPLLAREGVDALVFKGPVGQASAYGGYFMKPSVDVDLLVAERDFDRAREVLATDGLKLPPMCDTLWWRVFLGEQHLFADDLQRAQVDLHHKLQQPGCPSPRRLRRILEDKTTIVVAGSPVPTLSPVDAILLACMSLAKALTHHEAGGGHAADLAARLLACDGAGLEAVRSAAREQGLANTLTLGLQAARALFGVVTPAPGDPSGDRRGLLDRSDADLAVLLLTPSAPAAPWPRRRAILRALCDTPVSHAGEIVLAAVSELCRRWYEPRGASAGGQV